MQSQIQGDDLLVARDGSSSPSRGTPGPWPMDDLEILIEAMGWRIHLRDQTQGSRPRSGTHVDKM